MCPHEKIYAHIINIENQIIIKMNADRKCNKC